jgi:predicted transcriptional regulator
MNHDIHPVQGDILRVLLYTPDASFTELNGGTLSSDHFTFHIKRLVEIGLVEKTSDARYRLTATGKEHANRF